MKNKKERNKGKTRKKERMNERRTGIMKARNKEKRTREMKHKGKNKIGTEERRREGK
jgi:hypothetical protein